MRRALGVAVVVLAVLVAGLHAADAAAPHQDGAVAHTAVDDLHVTVAPALAAVAGPRARPEPRVPVAVLLLVVLVVAAAATRPSGEEGAPPLPTSPPLLAPRRRGPPRLA